ncbi:hypothetical protein FORC065_3449 [Yersinia enterocolitica]|nr:hypothetical protein FORC065_3449 [Yersinia enterocolitica]
MVFYRFQNHPLVFESTPSWYLPFFLMDVQILAVPATV